MTVNRLSLHKTESMWSDGYDNGRESPAAGNHASRTDGKNRESKRELAAYHNIMQGMVGSANERIDRLEIIVETAITKAVHELIERLRYDDIQAIDEEEFAAAVRKLIFDADPGVQLPF